MPKNRFFVDALFSLNEIVEIKMREAHHLVHVMRASIDEIVELVNGCHQLARAKVITTKKDQALLQILELEEKPPPSFPLILCQAIPRLNRLDTILEKGTELGMSELRLFPGELSEKKLISTHRSERMKAVTIAAMKQCGRLDLPKITSCLPLLKWRKSDLIYPAYFGDIHVGAPSWASVWQKGKGLFFFIGPESGFSETEEAHLRSLGVMGVALHPNILRTDTAPLVALSLAFHYLNTYPDCFNS